MTDVLNGMRCRPNVAESLRKFSVRRFEVLSAYIMSIFRLMLLPKLKSHDSRKCRNLKGIIAARLSCAVMWLRYHNI